MVDENRINNTLGKMGYHLNKHKSICVSVSGGSDSDVIVHIICTYFREFLYKIHFVFADTGIEYDATKRHLKYLEDHYGIKINRVKGTPIPIVCKQYGVPLCSKRASEYIQRLQKHKFKFEDKPLNALLSEYPRCKAALRWWCNDWEDVSRFNIKWRVGLKEQLISRPLDYYVSAMCCTLSKKRPLTKFQKSVQCDLLITGERKSEGGSRVGGHSDCFETKANGLDHYIPLWFWNDNTKKYYEQQENITHSDCYSTYGLKRTGCVGCPFGQDIAAELDVIYQYEPKLYKLVWAVFGKSYTYQGLKRRDYIE